MWCDVPRARLHCLCTASLILRRTSRHWILALQVHEEQAALRPDPEAVVTGEVLGQMTYTRQVVREILRYRPPAPMVPQVRPASPADYLVPMVSWQACNLLSSFDTKSSLRRHVGAHCLLRCAHSCCASGVAAASDVNSAQALTRRPVLICCAF